MRVTAPGWDEALRRGKESVVCDLKQDPAFARALCGRADVVVEGFRPGVAARLGVGPYDVPPEVVHCSITGFGLEGRIRPASGTTSTTSAGRERSRTRARHRPSRSPISPPERSVRSPGSWPLCSRGSEPAAARISWSR